MKVTMKGQVTIPSEIRERLDIHPGAELEFQVDGNVVKLIPVNPSHHPDRSPEHEFRRLAHQWREETRYTSSMSSKLLHPAYQQIIGMGQPVVPLILRALAHEPDDWFWALRAITRDDPIPQEHYGDLRKMTEDWLGYGKRHGYLP